MRKIVVLFGLVVLLFGLAVANYAKPSTLEDHRDWAAEHDMPEPVGWWLYAGFGGALVGLVIGARGLFARRKSR